MANKTKYPFSVHSFMVPLRWDYLPSDFDIKGSKESIDFDIRTDVKEFAKLLENTAWKRTFYRINNSPELYNENTYFHAFATRTLFDMQQHNEIDESVISDNKTMVYYEIETDENDYYKINADHKIYKLKLSGLSLHIYNTGVAILTYNLENWQYAESEQILQINEFGRRIYPQFLSNEKPYTEATKKTFLARELEIQSAKLNYGIPIQDDFTQYDTLEIKDTHKVDELGNYQPNTIIDIPNIIKKLFNDNFIYTAKEEINTKNRIRFNILIDDRMFFQSWFGNNALANSFSKEIKLHDNETNGFAYAHSNFWYAYMYGDKTEHNLGIANKFMQEKNSIDNTYDRWVEYGTLFGFTRDSFVCISKDLETFRKPDVRIHMKTMYYQMAVLCLAQRATVLRFSAEVSGLADLGKTNKAQVSKRIQQLYLNYIEFINKIYFREVTPQIQGIEIYSKFQQIMNIHNDVKDLDNEISELHEYVSLLQDEERNEEAAKLNRLATIFLPATLVFGILGANFFNDDKFLSEFLSIRSILWIAFGFIPSIIIYYILKNKRL